MDKLKYILISFLLLLLFAATAPFLFPFYDPSPFYGNYRIPYSQGEDYFLYHLYSEYTGEADGIPFIGDSVIWGHYTDSENTLPAQLNSIKGKRDFINMGLDGIHPAAMNGLIKNYSADLKKRKIIAGINLLWMSSPRHDLSGPVNSEINHKQLLSQFYPEIPSYKPSFEDKLSAVISRTVPFFSWIDHIRLTGFAQKSFYMWTMDNPHNNISEYFLHKEEEFKVPASTPPDKMQQQDIDWITPKKSLQWKFMIETLLVLKENGNDVAAVITPFNTYMMTEESRKKYFSILAEMEWILREKGITPILPPVPVLEKKYFADSSHPTAEGYRLIAEDMLKNREFAGFIKE